MLICKKQVCQTTSEEECTTVQDRKCTISYRFFLWLFLFFTSYKFPKRTIYPLHILTGHSVQPHRRENATPSMTPSTSRRYPTSLSAQLWIVTINNYHLISSACLSVSWMKNTSFPQCKKTVMFFTAVNHHRQP